jgi:hypothetical protein
MMRQQKCGSLCMMREQKCGSLCMMRQQKREAKKNYIFCSQLSIIVRDKCKNETHVHVQKQENKTAASLIISYVRDIL